MTAGPCHSAGQADVMSSRGRPGPDRIDHLVLAKAAKVAQASALFDHPARADAGTAGSSMSRPLSVCSSPMTAALRPASSPGWTATACGSYRRSEPRGAGHLSGCWAAVTAVTVLADFTITQPADAVTSCGSLSGECRSLSCAPAAPTGWARGSGLSGQRTRARRNFPICSVASAASGVPSMIW